MLSFTGGIKVLVALEACDMRKRVAADGVSEAAGEGS